jgi:predicted RNase H-like HicB family nuclease
MKFKVLIERDEDGYYVATVPALPGCISQGRTEMEANQNIKEAIELHLKCLAEDGAPLTTRSGVRAVAVCRCGHQSYRYRTTTTTTIRRNEASMTIRFA